MRNGVTNCRVNFSNEERLIVVTIFHSYLPDKSHGQKGSTDGVDEQQAVTSEPPTEHGVAGGGGGGLGEPGGHGLGLQDAEGDEEHGDSVGGADAVGAAHRRHQDTGHTGDCENSKDRHLDNPDTPT